ncbi:MAG: hypothetical protein NZM04_09650 [Methylacidiphilales bacterium]|nr:hypothetical protein [Candidatus Methylacidiphilales bacterium]
MSQQFGLRDSLPAWEMMPYHPLPLTNTGGMARQLDVALVKLPFLEDATPLLREDRSPVPQYGSPS